MFSGFKLKKKSGEVRRSLTEKFEKVASSDLSTSSSDYRKAYSYSGQDHYHHQSQPEADSASSPCLALFRSLRVPRPQQLDDIDQLSQSINSVIIQSNRKRRESSSMAIAVDSPSMNWVAAVGSSGRADVMS